MNIRVYPRQFSVFAGFVMKRCDFTGGDKPRHYDIWTSSMKEILVFVLAKAFGTPH
jgi:hypothetical protein